MTAQQGGGMFFVGEVRDIRDPDEAGKMKIIVHGHHNTGEKPIDDADLPWAHCIMNNSPSLNGIGSTSNYLPGTSVVGFWMDPETKQIPYIIGSLHKAGVTKD